MRVLKRQKPELLERAIAASCYLSCGLIGLIYILLSGKQANSSFFRFHFLQSIIIGLFTYLLGWVESIIKDIVAGISGVIINIFGHTANLFAPAVGIISIINGCLGSLLFLVTSLAFLLLLYGFVFALLGKYAEIPGLSRLVYRQLRG